MVPSKIIAGIVLLRTNSASCLPLSKILIIKKISCQILTGRMYSSIYLSINLSISYYPSLIHIDSLSYYLSIYQSIYLSSHAKRARYLDSMSLYFSLFSPDPLSLLTGVCEMRGRCLYSCYFVIVK